MTGPSAPRPMRRLATLAILGAALAIQGATRMPSAPSADWSPVAEGVDYREYVLPLPNRVFVTRMDLSNPNVILDTGVAAGTLEAGKETVAGIAERYDGVLNAWGGAWGPRNDVVAAINGSSFDLTTGVPLGGQYASGWMIQRYAVLAGGSGLVWTSDRKAFVGGCILYNGPPQTLTVARTKERVEIDALNIPRDNDGLWLFTPQFSPRTPEGAGRILARVEIEGPIGSERLPGAVHGIVRELADGRGSIQIPFGHVVLAGRGPSAEPFLRTLREGDAVGFSSDPVDLDLDCEGRTGHSWRDVYATLGGGFVFLRDGRIRTSADAGENSRDPRTAVCLNDEKLYFVVVDGRQDSWSVGMTLGEVGSFCQDELGAEFGINQDGGGSSTLWVDGTIRNRPSDGNPRPVGNGWMMIVLEPAQRSQLFDEGFRTWLQRSTDLRTGPGTDYPTVHALPAGQEVVISNTLADVQGVYARGAYWWRVNLGDDEGWIAQDTLLSPDRSLAVFKIPKRD